MMTINHFIDQWPAVLILHLFETSLFILLVWTTDRLVKLPAKFRYWLWFLALVKIFVPPAISLPSSVAQSIPSAVLSLPAFSVLENETSASLNWQSILGIIWAAVSGLLLLFMFAKNIKLRIDLLAAKAIEHQQATDLPIFESAVVSSPILIGLRRQRLYVPLDWQTWDSHKFRSVVAHETAHKKFGDIWVLLFQQLALVLFWMNPLVWLMHYTLNHVRELCCDEYALQQSGISPTHYGRVLLSFMHSGWQPALSIGQSFSERKKSIFARVEHILTIKEEKTMKNSWQHLLIPAIIAVLILPLSWHCDDGTSTETSLNDKGVSPGSAETSTAKAQLEFDQPPSPNGGFQAIQKHLRYPEKARKAGTEGRVVLKVLIAKDGHVKEVEVVQSLTKECDDAAIAAIQAISWNPAQKDTQPVEVKVAIPIVFKLS